MRAWERAGAPVSSAGAASVLKEQMKVKVFSNEVAEKRHDDLRSGFWKLSCGRSREKTGRVAVGRPVEESMRLEPEKPGFSFQRRCAALGHEHDVSGLRCCPCKHVCWLLHIQTNWPLPAPVGGGSTRVTHHQGQLQALLRAGDLAVDAASAGGRDGATFQMGVKSLEGRFCLKWSPVSRAPDQGPRQRGGRVGAYGELWNRDGVLPAGRPARPGPPASQPAVEISLEQKGSWENSS